MEEISPDEYRIWKELDIGSTSYIYGEIDNKSFKNILEKYEIINKQFLDIGSGSGRLLINLSSCFIDTEFNGVEIDLNRYNNSINKLKLYPDVFENSNLHFENLDFRKCFFGNYDIIYCCNIVFEQQDNNDLYNKIISEFSGICFLFIYNEKMKYYFHKKYTVNTSWQKDVPLYCFII